VWDGYPAARTRVFDAIEHDKISNVVVLTGDIHSSWALELPETPRAADVLRPSSGTGSLAVELVTPAISSPPFFASQAQRDAAKVLAPFARHLKYLDGEHRGYILLDISRERLQADWYHVPSVTERSDNESKAASFVCERGSAHLARS
jgi:alkaline phosphatase D